MTLIRNDTFTFITFFRSQLPDASILKHSRFQILTYSEAMSPVSFLKKYLTPHHYHDENMKLQNIFKPMYYTLSFIGLIPYNLKFPKNKHGFVAIRKSIYANAICALSIVMAVYTFFAFHLSDIFISSESISMTDVIMTKMNYILELVNLLSVCTVTYICAFSNRWKYINILNEIYFTWNQVPNDNRNRILAQLRFHVNVVALGTVLVMLAIQACVNFSRDNSFWKMILVMTTYNLPQTIQFITIAFFYVLIMMVVVLLKNINDNFTKMAAKHVANGYINVEPKSFTTLRKLELSYVKAFEIKEEINEAFQTPILLTALQCFHCMVSEGHIIYHGVVIEKLLSTHEVINCALWIFYQVVKVYALAVSGNYLKNEIAKAGRLLHNLPIEKQDARFLMEVQHFSSMMQNQKTELTVFGFFALDGTLIFNIATSGTMYLIILVQFDKTNNS